MVLLIMLSALSVVITWHIRDGYARWFKTLGEVERSLPWAAIIAPIALFIVNTAIICLIAVVFAQCWRVMG